MGNINWTVRIKNKTFWISFIPTLLLLFQVVAHLIGFEIEVDGIAENLLEVVNVLFVILATLGIVTDPTTEGTGDSLQAMLYTEPKTRDSEMTVKFIAEVTENTDTSNNVEDITVNETETEAETTTKKTTKKKSTKKTTEDSVEE